MPSLPASRPEPTPGPKAHANPLRVSDAGKTQAVDFETIRSVGPTQREILLLVLLRRIASYPANAPVSAIRRQIAAQPTKAVWATATK
jgi:hypothetical protein